MSRYEFWVQVNWCGSIRFAVEVGECDLTLVDSNKDADHVFLSHWPEGEPPYTMGYLGDLMLDGIYVEEKLKTLALDIIIEMTKEKKDYLAKDLEEGPVKKQPPDWVDNDCKLVPKGKVVCYYKPKGKPYVPDPAS